jgi:hypothetical protein
MYSIIVLFALIALIVFIGFYLFTSKEGFDNNLVDILPIKISSDNNTITVPNTIHGYNGNDITIGGNVDITNDTVHKGKTFIKPAGPWVNVDPSIDMAIGDNDTGLNWKSDGIVSFWGNSQEIGTFGWDGITLKDNHVLELGKDQSKEVSAGKIGYQTFSGDSLDIVGAGQNAGSRKVHIFDDLNVGNNVNVNGTTTLNQTTVNGKMSIVGGNLLELGANTGKGWEGNGSISYKTSWDPNALNIIGAENSGPRKVHMWDDVEVSSNLRVNGTIKIGDANNYWIIQANQNGWLEFLHNGTTSDNTNDDVGHIIMSPAGDVWLARSSYKGWIADNLNYINNK